MSNLRDLRMSRKLGLAFGIVVTLCLIQGIASLKGLFKFDRRISGDLINSTTLSLAELDAIKEGMATVRRKDFNAALGDDASQRDKYVRESAA